MEDEDVVAGLRRITLTEPPLGFDPDDVATRAASRQRGRRATIAAGLGAAAVAAVAITVFARGGTPPPAPAASPEPSSPPTTSSLTMIGSPPPAEVTRRLVTPITKRLDEVFPTVLPNATDLRPAEGFLDSEDLGSVAADKYFRDSKGLYFVGVDVIAKGSRVARPFQHGPCGPNETCEDHPQPDGSVVLSKVSLLADGVSGTRFAIHFRNDGSVVSVRVNNVPDGVGAKGYPLTDQQLTRLATDPAFRIEK